ncbi:unnamed protein product [Protopolystoma xenopodis]|uniref:Uncharacterized protein n=1 Tax=Protopolystoma xenopodis TaxID=117903 RepID=A0A3S5AMM1_9PLAT|nr:unnamed protein product [Protopolystoma xenopodis]
MHPHIKTHFHIRPHKYYHYRPPSQSTIQPYLHTCPPDGQLNLISSPPDCRSSAYPNHQQYPHPNPSVAAIVQPQNSSNFHMQHFTPHNPHTQLQHQLFIRPTTSQYACSCIIGPPHSERLPTKNMRPWSTAGLSPLGPMQLNQEKRLLSAQAVRSVFADSSLFQSPVYQVYLKEDIHSLSNFTFFGLLAIQSPSSEHKVPTDRNNVVKIYRE